MRTLAAIEPGSKWGNKDIIVACVNGGVTCKYLQQHGDHALLVSANHAYPPIVVTDEMRVFGRVVRVVKDVVPG